MSLQEYDVESTFTVYILYRCLLSSLYSSIYSEYRGEIVQDGIKLSLGNRTRIRTIASRGEPL